MADVLVPEFQYKPLGRRGGTPDRLVNPKILWHTWEGTNWHSAESTFATYPPTVGVKIYERPRLYVPLNLHAFALKGSESDDEFVIQIEVAGFARNMRHLSKDAYRWLGENVVAPINRALREAGLPTVPAVGPPQGFRDELTNTSPPLASSRSPIRFSQTQFENFSGHCGHQHAPSPVSHWDPGFFDLETVLEAAEAADKPTPPPVTKPTIYQETAVQGIVKEAEERGWAWICDWGLYTRRYIQRDELDAMVVAGCVPQALNDGYGRKTGWQPPRMPQAIIHKLTVVGWYPGKDD
jgi:hypothetical protein